MKQQVEALNRQIGIAEKSVKATEENATAAAANAEATKRNVNVLIKGQRPWIVIDSLGAPPSLYEDRSEIPAPFDAVLAGIPFIVFNLKSVGDTVSKLVGTGSRFHLVPRKETAASEPEPALPDEPDYRIGPGALPQAGFVKAPNEGFQIANALEDGPILKDQIDAINDKTLFACAYGFVAYEDVFGEPHETRFCYVYRVSRRSMIQQGTGKNIYPSEFRLGGPDAYNRYT
jgi:hypothetical protein